MNLDALRGSFELPATYDLEQLVIQAVVLTLLSSLLSVVYFFTANSLSNRSRLAGIFPVTALSTMLIITIIRSSLALSLGLVGALSIVRFRSAIKDPEELVYIFLTIALGLGFGAEQSALTTVFYGIILVVMIGQALIRGRLGSILRVFSDKDSVHLELSFTEPQTLPVVTAMLDKHCSAFKLTRLHHNKQQVMMFLVKPRSIPALEALRTDSLKLDPKAELTLLQYQPLV